MYIKFIALVCLTLSFKGAFSAGSPPMAPVMYALGPMDPRQSITGIFTSESVAFALLEGVMQQADAVIASTSCSQSVGTFNIDIYSDGTVNAPNLNTVTVGYSTATYTLVATVNNLNRFRGQSMSIRQTGSGAFNRVTLFDYKAFASFNTLGTMMTMDSTSTVLGINGGQDAYQAKLIKDYERVIDSSTSLPNILDWGVQSLSKLNYPVDEYWQRSKTIRDDVNVGRTVLVNDRIVGPNACRIVIDTSGYNNMNYFWQTGTLTISTTKPSPDYVFNF